MFLLFNKIYLSPQIIIFKQILFNTKALNLNSSKLIKGQPSFINFGSMQNQEENILEDNQHNHPPNPSSQNEGSSQRVVGAKKPSAPGPVNHHQNQRLDKLIGDSLKRRTRQNREQAAVNAQVIVAATIEQLEEQKREEVRPRMMSEKTEEAETRLQQSEIVNNTQSNFDILSNGSRITQEPQISKLEEAGKKKSPPRTTKVSQHYLEKNKKLVETPAHIRLSKDVSSSQSTSQLKDGGTAVNAIKNAKLWYQNLRSEKPQPQPIISKVAPLGAGAELMQKLPKAKVNTNLRSTSAANQFRGRTKSPDQRAKDSQPSVKLGLSPQDRLNEDLQKRITEELKADIKEQVNTKYSDLEDMINKNYVNGQLSGGLLEGPIDEGPQTERVLQKPPPAVKKGVIVTNQPPKKTQPHAFNFATAQRNTQRRNESKGALTTSQTQQTPTPGRSTKPTVPHQTIELVPKTTKSKNGSIQRATPTAHTPAEKPAANKVAPKLQTSAKLTGFKSSGGRNQPLGQAKSIQPYAQQSEKIQPDFERIEGDTDIFEQEIPKKRVGSVKPDYIPRKRKLSNRNANKTVEPFLPDSNWTQVNLGSSIEFNDLSDVHHIPQQNNSVEETPSVSLPHMPVTQPDRPATQIQGHRKKASNSSSFKLKSKDDIMNLNIEDIWKEMEEIKRSKNAAQELFQAFQDKYYDQTAPEFFDQAQVSPTKRLISMKNATTKHHVIEYRKGITGRYAIQYTTCPEKSYVILPDDGETNYDKMRDKKAHQFVEKIINGKVEKVELEERGKRKKSNPKQRKITKNSPVVINSQKVQRAEMIGSFTLNINNEGYEEDGEEVYQEDENQEEVKPDIEQEEKPGRGVIFEENQRQQEEGEEESDQDDSIINISTKVVDEKLTRQLSSGITPVPTTQVPVPMSQEELQIDGQPETVPFLSDEQPIHIENNSIISAAHEEAIQVFDGTQSLPAPQKDEEEEQPEVKALAEEPEQQVPVVEESPEVAENPQPLEDVVNEEAHQEPNSPVQQQQEEEQKSPAKEEINEEGKVEQESPEEAQPVSSQEPKNNSKKNNKRKNKRQRW